MRGVTRASFCAIYYAWIDHVAKKFEVEMNQDLVTLCFSLSLMGRKALASASHQGNAQDPVRPELFLHGLHSLFQVLFAIFIHGYLTSYDGKYQKFVRTNHFARISQKFPEF